MLDRLDAARFADLLAIAKAPMDIRGYGPVKEAAIHKVQAEVERLWSRLAEQPEVSDTRRREAAHAPRSSKLAPQDPAAA